MESKPRSVFIEPRDVPALQRLGAWVALSVTVGIAFLLLIGF